MRGGARGQTKPLKHERVPVRVGDWSQQAEEPGQQQEELGAGHPSSASLFRTPLATLESRFACSH